MYFPSLRDDRIVPVLLRAGVIAETVFSVLIEIVRALLALIVLLTAGLHSVAVFLLALASEAEAPIDDRVVAFDDLIDATRRLMDAPPSSMSGRKAERKPKRGSQNARPNK